MRTLTYNRLAVPVHEHLLRTTDLLAPPDRRPRYRRPSWVPLTLHRSHEIACPLLPHNARCREAFITQRAVSPRGFPEESAQATGSPAPRAVRKHLWYLELAALEQLRGMYPLFEWQCT